MSAPAAPAGAAPLAPASADPVVRVTPLELFFDLVFVFTITQLTSLLVEDLSLQSLWRVAVMLGLIFYMYDGYAWLTNAVPARGTRRQGLLIGGMAGYLVLAITIPVAYDGAGLTFGLALLAITGLHAALFVRSAGEGPAAAMRRLGPKNLGVALLVVLGGALGGDAQAVLWTAGFVLEWLLTSGGGFRIGPAHFVERHGLLVIVAIGESIVASGLGASGDQTIDAQLVGVVVLGLLINAGLWWTYFGDDADVRVEAALEAAPAEDRARLALAGFGYAHYLLLLGVILAAVGIEAGVAHPGDRLELAVAAALSGGVALFLVGDTAFRRILGVPGSPLRLAAAAGVLVAIPAGTEISGAAGLAVTALVLGGALAAEQRFAPASAAASLPG